MTLCLKKVLGTVTYHSHQYNTLSDDQNISQYSEYSNPRSHNSSTFDILQSIHDLRYCNNHTDHVATSLVLREYDPKRYRYLLNVFLFVTVVLFGRKLLRSVIPTICLHEPNEGAVLTAL